MVHKLKKIRDLDSDEANAIFKEVQDEFHVTSGDVEPMWLMSLGRKAERHGLTRKQLKDEVSDYYRQEILSKSKARY